MTNLPADLLSGITLPAKVPVPELSVEGFDNKGLLYQWEQALQAGEQAFSKGASGDSERHYRAALRAAEAMDNGKLQEAEVLDRLGLLSVYNQKPDIGKTFLEKALKIRKLLLEPSNLALAESLQHVGSLYQTLGRYSEAESYLREAIQIRKKGSDKSQRRDLAASHISLAGVLWKTGRNSDGDKEVARGLSILESLLGNKNMEYSLILRNVYRTYLRFERLPKALEYIKMSVDVCEEADGKSSPSLTGLLSDYAVVLKAMKDFKDAEVQIERALEISVASYGPESPVTYKCTLLMVQILADGEKTDLARNKLDEAILLCQKMYGSNHPRVVKLKEKFAYLIKAGEESSLLNKIECSPEIGNLLRQWKDSGTETMKAGNYKTAIEYYKKAVDALERYSNFQDVYFVSLYGLAISYKSLDQYTIAETYMNRAVQVFDKLKGDDSTAMSEMLLSHLELLEKLGRFDETVNVFSRILLLEAERAVKSDIEGRGNKLSWLVKRFNWDGEEAFFKGKKAKAEAYFATAVSLAGQNALEELYALSLRNYSHFKEQTGEPVSVWKPLMLRASKMHEKTFSESPSDIFAMNIVFCDALFRHKQFGAEFSDLVCSLLKSGMVSEVDSLIGLREMSRWLGAFNRDYENRWKEGVESSYEYKVEVQALFNGIKAFLGKLDKNSAEGDSKNPRIGNDYLSVARIVAAVTAYRSGKKSEGAALFKEAFAFYLEHDGYLSPGCALVEYLWVHEAVRAENSLAGAQIRKDIVAIERLPGPLSKANCDNPSKSQGNNQELSERSILKISSEGYWVTLFEEPFLAPGKTANIIASFNELFERPGTTVIKKIMEQVLINVLLNQEQANKEQANKEQANNE
jgi:tetratricopeptide (TPR) repeat protein